MTNKVCTKCGVEKHLTEFSKDNSNKDGLMIYCKCCRKAMKAVYYVNNREKLRADHKEYYKANRQSVLNQRKNYYINNKENESAKNAEYRKNNQDAIRSSKYKQQYGITLDDFNNMRLAQNYCCAICGKHEDDNKNKKLFVDHDHVTGKVRQLLCHSCNTGIGLLQDDTDLLQKAISYLIKHKE
jgi:hypothetical protein